jgi:hypothetical protein
MAFYDEMQGIASELLAEFKQGTIIYNHPGAVSGDAWNPVQGTAVPYTLDAASNGVSQEYVDGTSVLATDREVAAAVFGQTPTTSGTISMDGRVLQIVRVIKIPAAGTAVSWKMIVRA